MNGGPFPWLDKQEEGVSAAEIRRLLYLLPPDRRARCARWVAWRVLVDLACSKLRSFAELMAWLLRR